MTLLTSIAPTIDWLTMTVRQPEARQRASALAATMFQEATEGGERVRAFSALGYRGHTIGGFSWGARPQDDICVLRGDFADRNWWAFSAYARQVSRVDLAVTCKLRSPDAGVAFREYSAICDVEKSRSLPRNYSLMTNLKGGDTLYVGKRSSVEFGRLYDKSAESGKGAIGSAWRYEVEIKKPKAKPAIEALRQEQDIRPGVEAYVWNWFFDRLCTPVYNPRGSAIVVERNAKISSVEVTLSWLRGQVKPAIIRLLEEGNGKGVTEALQLALFRDFL